MKTPICVLDDGETFSDARGVRFYLVDPEMTTDQIEEALSDGSLEECEAPSRQLVGAYDILETLDEDEECVVLEPRENFESAFLGLTYVDGERKSVYSTHKLIESFMKNEGMSYEDAVDWISFNIVGMGPLCPILVDGSGY